MAKDVRGTIIGVAARLNRACRITAGRRRAPGRAGVTPLAAVMAAALLALAPALSWAQLTAAQGRQESHQHAAQDHVQRVEITSSPGSGGFYKNGDDITVRVTFQGGAGSGPRLGLRGGNTSIRLNIGGVTRSATLSGPGHSKIYVLSYRVQTGDRDLDGISVQANSLEGDFSCGAGCSPDRSHSAVSGPTHRVLGTPSQPSGFSVTSAALLRWTRDSGAHSSRNYQYRYRAAGGGDYGSWRSAGSASASSYQVRNLPTGTYDFQLRARNQSGDGAAATASGVQVTTVTTGGGGAPSGPSAPGGTTVSVVADPASLTVFEGRSRTYRVDLSASPSGEVTVTIASSDDGVVTAAPAELTFTADNWSAPQTVTVTAAQDDDQADGSATLSHTASGEGVTATGPTVRVTVTDDDAEGVEVPDALTFGDKTVSAQSYTVGIAVKETLPAATGGTAPLSYALTPDPPAGLSFDAATRVLSGKPTEAAEQAAYTLTVTDAQNYTDELSFNITVQAAAADAVEADPAAKVRGEAMANVLATFGRTVAADAMEVIGGRFTAKGPLLQLDAGATDAEAALAGVAFAAPAPGGMALWGRGSMSGFDTATEAGSVLSGYLGVDWRTAPEILFGAAVAYSRAGDVNYNYRSADDGAVARGKTTITMAAVLPYAHYSLLPGLGLWAMAGLGGGTAVVTPAGSAEPTETAVSLSLGAAGGRYDLLGWSGGSAAVKADAFLAMLSSGEKPGLAAARSTPYRVRLLAEARHRWQFWEESWLEPVVEAGGRYDGALGAELAGGISYRHAGIGLGVDVRGRYLIAAPHQEWGASVAATYTLGESGWSFALIPEWGGMASDGAADLWAGSGESGALVASAPARLRLQAGYRPDESFSLNVAATREDRDAPVYGLLVHGSVRM